MTTEEMISVIDCSTVTDKNGVPTTDVRCVMEELKHNWSMNDVQAASVIANMIIKGLI